MCILALVYERDHYGYELVDSISKNLPISEGTVYPILRRLIQEGSCETYLKESPSGPPRKYYRMTKAGKIKTEELLGQWAEFVENVNLVLKIKTKKNKRGKSNDEATVSQ